MEEADKIIDVWLWNFLSSDQIIIWKFLMNLKHIIEVEMMLKSVS